MKEIYLENHAGTKIDERVFDAMLPFLRENYGNAQSMNSPGSISRDAVERARKQVAALIGAEQNEIYFTSCGSESNNFAIKGIAEAYKQKGAHLIVSEIEHFSVLHSARRLKAAGFEIAYLPVDKHGFVSPGDLKKALTPATILVSVQHANPEIGTIQPIEEISKICRENNVLFHTDAVCTAGTIPVDVNRLGADLLSLSGSRFYGPRGAAALYIRKGVNIIPRIDGGIQENGRRAGAENVAAIAGLGMAAEIAGSELDKNSGRMLLLRDRLILELPKKVEHVYLNGPVEKRLPNNANFSVEFIEGEGVFLLLDGEKIYVSSGSACASKSLKMSHVLSAIKVDPAVGQGSILMTLSKYTTEEDVDRVLSAFPPVVKKLREMSPLYAYFLKTGKRQAAGPGTDYKHDCAETVTTGGSPFS